MSKRDYLIVMRQMLDHAKEAATLMQNRSRKDLDEDRLINLAIVRLLEVIGEAATRIPKEERERYLAIPWSDIIGLRNRLIHGYDQIDFNIVWLIVTKSLPPLIVQLEQILK